ncbi:MAG: formyltransferase family protein, partial [Candidatus Thermoplasmatota archaeon]|nr:formyltransferase family protein [Candidatus Thermoplasmatota archaeon]
MLKVLIISNGSGYQLDKCLEVPLFKESIKMIVSDRACPVLDIAQKHSVCHVLLNDKNSIKLNTKILNISKEENIDYIISVGFTRLFKELLLKEYKNKILNCHPSILPAFRGFYDTRDVHRKFHARKIYERTLDFGSRVTGNTIHIVTENVDEGRPVLVSYMNIPYGENPDYTRHRLFIQECKTLLQIVLWLSQDRLL